MFERRVRETIHSHVMMYHGDPAGVAAAHRPDPIPHGARVLRLATRIAEDVELGFQSMKADVNVALLWRDPCGL